MRLDLPRRYGGGFGRRVAIVRKGMVEAGDWALHGLASDD